MHRAILFVRSLLALVFLAAALSSPIFISPAQAGKRTVHVSLVLICDIYDMDERNGRGGFARLSSVIKAERVRSKNVVVAHAGDAISPSLFSGFDKGAHIIDLTNMIAPDIFVPGNHEFDFGEKIYRKRMSEATFPILAANLRDADGRRLPGHKDVKIYTFEGVRIAFIGLTADNSPSKSQPGKLKFRSTVQTAKRLAKELREQGVDIVVAVAHAGRRQDLRLFYSHDLDVLLSGDDHDLALLYDGKTAMVEAKQEGEYVVAVDLEITIKESSGKEKSGTKRNVKWWPRFRIIDTADVMPDAKVAARVADYQKVVAKELDVALGKTATEMDSSKAAVRMGEAAIGNLIADAMRARFNSDFAIMNGGGIRGNRVYAAGETLTRRDVLKELPFGNKLYVVEMSGADLLNALENSLRFAGKPHGRFGQISGGVVKARLKAIPGQKITSVMIGGIPLDPLKLYKVATNDFILAGKEGYDVFRTARKLVGAVDAPLIANVVMSYIRKRDTVSAKVEGRIILE